MSSISRRFGLVLIIFGCIAWCVALPAAAAEDPKPAAKDAEATKEKEAPKEKDKEETPKPKYPPFATLMKDAKSIPGLLPLHRKESSVYVELSPSQLNKDYIVLISIARGIGRGSLLGGMSWGFGDDWIWQFRKADDRIHVVRRNVRFTAASGSPEEKAVRLAYTDSVLFSLPIATIGPSGGYVVDLNPVFMSDLPQISRALPGFSFAGNKSTWATVKGFPDNVELEVAATYASSGGAEYEFDSVADARGATINVHYSISALPQTGYQPRQADDRVGHFITALKDYSKKSEDDRFVRYIDRWDLVKADSSSDISPPKKPIVFWLEKTIPFKYRKPIRDGILEWNRAFEKAGFVNAIEVRQQPDNADWDPEDINYNTFRWITSSAGMAMGPSRVNPTTGQILDADIIFDADFLQFWKQEYEDFTPQSIAAMTGGPLTLPEYLEHLRVSHQPGQIDTCSLSSGMAPELAFASTVMMAQPAGPAAEAEKEKLIMQGLKWVAMHELGHTLGLRHNFKASSYLSLADANDLEKTKDIGLAASVMDYVPVNFAPKGSKQGDYYSGTIGPYDMWAIEYGYKPLSGGTDGELAELKKIAARSGEAALAYATDEDTRGIDSDPTSNRFDLGKDPIEYARQRAKLIGELWPDILSRVTKDGDGYQKARRAFGVLLGNYGQAMYFASREVGGVYVNRAHKGDADAQAPFVIVDAAKQRDALTLLEEQVFSDTPFQFPPDLYNHLAASRWYHWGSDMPPRTDYAVHQVISLWQDRILQQLMSPLTLTRLHDSELKVPADQEAFTTADLLQRLTKTIFSETDKLSNDTEYTNRKPAISSLRRNLQRSYLKRLSELVIDDGGAPEDCQTIAYMQLKMLEGRINQALAANSKLDDYSRAHLEESASRIHKVLDARFTMSKP